MYFLSTPCQKGGNHWRELLLPRNGSKAVQERCPHDTLHKILSLSALPWEKASLLCNHQATQAIFPLLIFWQCLCPMVAAYSGLPFVKSPSPQPHTLSILCLSLTLFLLPPLKLQTKPCHLSDAPFMTSAFTLPTSHNKNHHKYQNQHIGRFWTKHIRISTGLQVPATLPKHLWVGAS